MLISLHLRCYGRKHLKSRSTIFTALPSFIKTVISLEEAIGLVKYGSAFYKSTMTTPNDLPILYMLEIISRTIIMSFLGIKMKLIGL